MSPDDIDWARVCEPQQSAYDTSVALGLAERELNWLPPPHPTPPHAFDGRVALRTPRPDVVLSPLLGPGPLDHPNLRWAETCLKTAWPAVHQQFAALIAEIALMDVRQPSGGARTGSHSNHIATPPFAIYVTFFDAFGAAESLVHELAHIKLHCLGVQIESSSRLIVNLPTELYRSPVRSYGRPMTAVLHAFYSWLHITELDIRWAAVDPQRAVLRLRRNCEWIKAMAREIAAYARTDAAGAQFLPALFAWAKRLVTQGQALLHEVNSGSFASSINEVA